MSVIQPDFSEAIDMSPIPEGIYPAKVISFEGGTSKTGNPKLVGKVEVTVGDKTREREVNWPTTGKGSGSLQQYLRAIDRDDLAVPGAPAYDTDEIVNIDFMAVIEHQQEGQYRGRDFIANCLKA